LDQWAFGLRTSFGILGGRKKEEEKKHFAN
jgi:hypothetical protein